MKRFDFMLEDASRMRFVRVTAKDAVDALIKAMRETGILNPENVFQKGKNGKYISFQL